MLVRDLGPNALQGDGRFADVLEAMGCTIRRDASGTTVERTGELRGISIDMADLSDLVPTLAVVAPFASLAATRSAFAATSSSGTTSEKMPYASPVAASMARSCSRIARARPVPTRRGSVQLMPPSGVKPRLG